MINKVMILCDRCAEKYAEGYKVQRRERCSKRCDECKCGVASVYIIGKKEKEERSDG